MLTYPTKTLVTMTLVVAEKYLENESQLRIALQPRGQRQAMEAQAGRRACIGTPIPRSRVK